MDDFSAVLRGATILRRYEHPKSWWNGNTVGDPRLVGKNVLFIAEIQRGPGAGISDIEARANAEAIRAWAAYSNLVRNVDALVINDPAHDAYVAIPQAEWGIALPILQAL